MTRRYTRRLTRSQRLLLELQKITDAHTQARETIAAFKPVLLAVARNDFMEAQHALDHARPYLNSVHPPLKHRLITAEFKMECVSMLEAAPYGTRTVIMRKLGISSAQAYTWMRLYRKNGGFKKTKTEPKIGVKNVLTPEQNEQLTAAKAAFGDHWYGGKRLAAIPNGVDATPSSSATLSRRPPQHGVVRKNASPFQKV